METSKVSIVVPVYNAAEFLPRCIDSILNQTYKNIEVILVNDGSLDDSASICERYGKLDKRVVVINKPNGGASSARNAGLLAATGKYLQFVDSDDYIDNNMTEMLVKAISDGADVAICGIRIVSSASRDLRWSIVASGLEMRSFSISQFNENFSAIFRTNILNSPCNKLYLRELIRGNGLSFPLGVTLGEDLALNLSYFSLCKKIIFVPETLYVYARRAYGSLCSGDQDNRFDEGKQAIGNVQAYLGKSGYYIGENVVLIESVFAEYVIESIRGVMRSDRWPASKAKIGAIKAIIGDQRVIDNNKHVRYAPRNAKLLYLLVRRQWAGALYLAFRMRALLKCIKP